MELQDFQFLSKLGRGGYGYVYLGLVKRDKNNFKRGQAVAIKAVHKKSGNSINREIKVRKKN